MRRLDQPAIYPRADASPPTREDSELRRQPASGTCWPMTTIAALYLDDRTVVGSNTGYTLANDSVISSGDPPWVSFQDWALGFTGSMLALNVCRSALSNLKSKLSSEGDVVK